MNGTDYKYMEFQGETLILDGGAKISLEILHLTVLFFFLCVMSNLKKC